MDGNVKRLVLLSELPNNPTAEDQAQPEAQLESQPESQPELQSQAQTASDMEPQESQVDVDQHQAQQQVGEVPVPVPVSAPESVEAKPVLTCYTLGPVTTIYAAATVSKMLEKAGVTSETRETEDKIPNGYWVHLPVEKNATTAQQLLVEIQNRDISDVSTVPLEDGGYVVSLGVFSEEIRAKRRQNQFIKMGYKPVVDQRYKTKTLTWFDVKDSESTLLVPDVFKTLAAKFPGIKMQETDC